MERINFFDFIKKIIINGVENNLDSEVVKSSIIKYANYLKEQNFVNKDIFNQIYVLADCSSELLNLFRKTNKSNIDLTSFFENLFSQNNSKNKPTDNFSTERQTTTAIDSCYSPSKPVSECASSFSDISTERQTTTVIDSCYSPSKPVSECASSFSDISTERQTTPIIDSCYSPSKPVSECASSFSNISTERQTTPIIDSCYSPSKPVSECASSFSGSLHGRY